MGRIDEQAVERIAGFFRTLSEQTRLKLLFALRAGELNVTELTAATGCGQANVSKHLTQLAKSGFVVRTMRGTNAYYQIADPEIFEICDIVSGKIADLIGAQLAIQASLRKVAQKAGKSRKAPGSR